MSMSTEAQVHDHFKVFMTTSGGAAGVSSLSAEVSAWVSAEGVAAKSIGIEYLEATGVLVLTVGYRRDEPTYPVGLHALSLGRIETLDAASLASLETRMAVSAAGVKQILCHELFVTADREFFMVFMAEG
jgi:hypothetical protein